MFTLYENSVYNCLCLGGKVPVSHKISLSCAISPHTGLQISNELKTSCQNNHNFSLSNMYLFAP